MPFRIPLSVPSSEKGTVFLSTIAVSKTVEGAVTNQQFEFTAEFTGLKPNSTINTSTAGRIIADADGYATKTFFLKSGEKRVYCRCSGRCKIYSN